MNRPAAGPLTLNQLVFVTEGYGRSRGEQSGRIVKIARVWVTIESLRDPSVTWRLRIAEQNAGTGYATESRFETIEQYEYRVAEGRARKILRRAGLTVEYSGSWVGKDRLVKLADWLIEQDPELISDGTENL
ncbi:hypothetical protein ACIA8K_12785 [Catenuloplanes sp. NPDC051500]|uniref:hypothetical protein n=1 Tax=Catenuloplanes sp. NPDC051500 TaxID=3363959 RepID=UPI00378BEDB3